jgi:hypothetical protein
MSSRVGASLSRGSGLVSERLYPHHDARARFGGLDDGIRSANRRIVDAARFDDDAPAMAE